MFNEDFIKENGLEDNQVQAITTFIESELKPEIKKEFEGVANQNAEGILTGVSKSISKKFGLELERGQGEKLADYIERLGDEGLSSKAQALKTKEAELEEKLKNFKGSDEIKQQLLDAQKKNDELLKQVAELEPLKGFDLKYQEATEKLTSMQKEVAYSNIKPTFPKEVNPYEADAKWNAFKAEIEAKYDIVLEDGKPIAIDKENHHKKVELKTLLEKDVNISELLQGRQQRGTGANSADLIEVDGLPFQVKKGATNEELSIQVREHLEKELGNKFHPKFNEKMIQYLTLAKKAAK